MTLWSIARGRTRVLFVPLPAAMARFRDRAFYGSLALELRLRDEIDLDDMVEHLARIGYEAGEPVTNVGQYSVRGGIVDVFPPEAANPLRIEFFGDTIESLREFDPATQRSQKPITSTTLLPLAETPRSPRFFAALVGALLLRQGSGIRGPRSEERESGVRSQELQPGISPNPESRIPNPEPEWAAQYSGPFPGWEFFVPLAEPHPNSLLSLLDQSVRNAASGSSLLVWDEKLGRMQELRRALEGHAAAYDEVRDIVPRRPQPEDVFLTEDEFLKSVEGAPQVSLKEFGVRSSEFGVELANSELSNSELFLPTEPAPKFHGAIKAFIEVVKSRLAGGERVAFVMPTAGKVERLREILKEYEIPFTTDKPEVRSQKSEVRSTNLDVAGEPQSEIEDRKSKVENRQIQNQLPTTDSRLPTPALLVRGRMPEGIIVPELRLLLLGDADLFGGFDWGAPGRRERSRASSFISDLSDLKVGDYVVHVDHGIGLYQGLRQLGVEGAARDFMLLTYQDDAKLYVPLERLDLVEKFRSSGDGADYSYRVVATYAATTSTNRSGVDGRSAPLRPKSKPRMQPRPPGAVTGQNSNSATWPRSSSGSTPSARCAAA